MAIRTAPWPHGVPCWVDVTCTDVDRSRAFYQSVLGWDYWESSGEFGGYLIAHRDGHATAGLGPVMASAPPMWTLYFANDDATAGAEAIRAAGGQVLVEPQQVGGAGRFVVAADPTGAMFGLWEAGDMNGCQLVNAPGGLTWEDLRSSDPERARAFYRSVLGVETAAFEMAGGDYHTFTLPGSPAPLGGMGGMMGEADDPDSRPHWLVYFGVEDAGTAAREATSAGGSVTAPAFQTPFGLMVGLRDPDGSEFWAIQAPEDWPRPAWNDTAAEAPSADAGGTVSGAAVPA
ncbi:MAG: VOC family protein [Actinomycetes bacterium]